MTTKNQCPVCKRTFTTPQGLGLHFMWDQKKRDKATATRRTKRKKRGSK